MQQDKNGTQYEFGDKPAPKLRTQADQQQWLMALLDRVWPVDPASVQDAAVAQQSEVIS